MKNDNENGEFAEDIVLTELPEETRMMIANGLALRPSTAAARDPDAVVHDADAEASTTFPNYIGTYAGGDKPQCTRSRVRVAIMFVSEVVVAAVNG